MENRFRTGEEMIRTWARQAQSSEVLTMTPSEVASFAAKNNFAIYKISATKQGELVGWRLYQTVPDPEDPTGKTQIPGKLYYVVRKRDIIR